MKKIYFLLCMLLLGNGIATFGQTVIFTEHFSTLNPGGDPTNRADYTSTALADWTVEAGTEYYVATHDWEATTFPNPPGPGQYQPESPENIGVGIANTTTQFDSWLISPAISLTAGRTYVFSFGARASATASAPNIDVKAGNAASVAGLTTMLTETPFSLTNVWKKYEVTFTPETTGTYHFGIRGYKSNTTGKYLVLDLVEVIDATPDVGVSAITAPASGVNLSSACDVTITVKNYGGSAISNIPVTYTINGGTPVATETIPGPIDPGAEVSYTFTATADLSTQGKEYVINAYTLLTGDGDATNDAATATVRNLLNLDAGVTSVTEPVSGINLSGVTVTITVKNFGEYALSNIPVTFTVDGGTAVATETVPGPVDPGEEVSYTFTATADLSAEGDHVINAYTLLTDDTDESNNAASATVHNTYAYDAGVTAITAPPTDGVNLSNAAAVAITVKNIGRLSLSNIPVTYTVNGGTPVATETVPGPVAPGEETSYTFTAKANLSATGNYVIKAWTLAGEDVDRTNDTIAITVTNTICSAVAAPWSESFSGSTFPPSSCWTNRSATDNAWKWVSIGNYPTCSSYDGDNGMLQYNSYAYAANSKGVLTLPPVATDKEVSFSFWMYRDKKGFSSNPDHVNVYISDTQEINGATPALTVYRANSLEPVESDEGWYQYSVAIPAGTASSQKFIMLEGVSAYGNNIYVDKLELTTVSGYDASVTAITAPVSGTDLSDAETVSIKVKNLGSQTLSNIPVTFTVDNGASVATETVPGPVAQNEETVYTFSAKADLSAGGDHVIKAYTLLENDTNLANDTLEVTISNLICEISNFPYSHGFEDETVTPCITTNTSIALVNNVVNYHSGAASCPLYSSYAPGSNVSLTFPQMPETDVEKKVTYWMKAMGTDAKWQVGYITAAGDTVFNEEKSYPIEYDAPEQPFVEMTDLVAADAVKVIIRNTSGQRLFIDDVTINKRGLGIPSVNGSTSVYPTLSKGKITVNTAGKSTVRIIDLSGKVMAAYESNTVLEIDLPYANGIYFVTIGNEKDRSVFKVILRK